MHYFKRTHASLFSLKKYVLVKCSEKLLNFLLKELKPTLGCQKTWKYLEFDNLSKKIWINMKF